MARAFGFSGPGMLSRDTVRPNTALTTTLGTSARIALDGGRTTIVNTVASDPVALGWYRVTDGEPCAFCALMASRGVVYKDHAFDRSNTQFTGPGMAKVHNDCGCGFAPSFTRKQELPEISKVADQIYTKHAAGAGTGNQLAAFRKAWAAHQAAQPAAK
jgi:hypothetical protein